MKTLPLILLFLSSFSSSVFQVWEAPEGRAAGGEDGPKRLQQVEARGDAGVRGGDDEDEDGAGEVSPGWEQTSTFCCRYPSIPNYLYLESERGQELCFCS